nr:uncharacterized protein LOC109770635 [Aegilops tauschii subsp. strangulata]
MPPKKYVIPRAAATATASVAQPKQRKPRAPPSKPPGMPNAEWRVEVRRREAVTADRRNRAIAKKACDNATRAAAAAASADQAEAEATRAGMMNPPGSHAQYALWGQQSVGSPSPQPWGSPSPSYADGDALGGFNPNVTFPHGHPAQRTPSPAFAGVQCPSYNYSPPAYASSPTPHHAVARCPSRTSATPTRPRATWTTSSRQVRPRPPRLPGRKKKKRAARSGEPRIKWASKEEECLAEAWKVACLDSTTGTNQSIETYWDRIKAEFDERKLVDPYFKGIYMQRGSKAMANHWGLGGSPAHPQQAKETYKPDAPTPGASEGRPDGNKGAKKGKHADAATARVQESIEHCLADAQARAVLREEKTDMRWSALMSSSAAKLDLLRTNVAAKKRNTDLAFLLGRADMLQSNDEAFKAWYLAERGLILNQLPSRTPPTPTPTPTPPPSPSNDVAETPRSTEATSTPPSTETLPSPRTPTPPTPEADLAV